MRRLHRKASRKRIKKGIRRKKRIKITRGRPKKVFLPEKIKQLIQKGKQRGFVTGAEILDFFPETEKDIKGLESFYETLEREGIEVKEAREFLKVEEKEKRRKNSESVS